VHGRPSHHPGRGDIADVTGLTLPVIAGARPHDGDVFLSLSDADKSLGAQGYALRVGDAAVIRADDGTGAYYGTQTLLQILKTMPGHRSMPRGQARDWPKEQERGILLDAGRKFYSPDFIVRTIREMSYLRLNTLQLHFSDHNASAWSASVIRGWPPPRRTPGPTSADSRPRRASTT
jgi:hexosaminidase